MNLTGDHLLSLLGKPLRDAAVQTALATLGLPWLPEITADRPCDWLYAGALEIGFEDHASFHAVAVSPPEASPVVQQLCFYAPRPGGADLPVSMPLGLAPGASRHQVRARLQSHAKSMRFALRDVGDLKDGLTVSVSYDANGGLDAVLVIKERPHRASLAETPFTCAQIQAMLGLAWYADKIRDTFYTHPAHLEALGEIKRHGSLNLIRELGLRLLFDLSGKTARLAAWEIYRGRVRDAADWTGDLPYGITFEDLPDQINARTGVTASLIRSTDQESTLAWSIGELRLVIVFDLVLNRIAALTFGQSTYWR